jgi:hypothetical protein
MSSGLSPAMAPRSTSSGSRSRSVAGQVASAALAVRSLVATFGGGGVAGWRSPRSMLYPAHSLGHGVIQRCIEAKCPFVGGRWGLRRRQLKVRLIQG